MVHQMPLAEQATHYGNLMSYKIHTMPITHKLYGGRIGERTRHQNDVRYLLHTMFINGACTTWDMAKMVHPNIDMIRKKEKIWRRLLIGRSDGGAYNSGIFDLGLVTKRIKGKGKRTSYQYHLTLHGILYCMDALNPTNKEIDVMTSRYSDLLPRVFGKWKSLKSALGDDVYRLRILSKGILLDSPVMRDPENTLYPLMLFVHIKYARNLESITEHNLAEQVSYWFYTFLLYPHLRSRKTLGRAKRTRHVLEGDPDLNEWYSEFFEQAADHYGRIFRGLKDLRVPP